MKSFALCDAKIKKKVSFDRFGKVFFDFDRSLSNFTLFTNIATE
jgi:hypothetical protein